MESKLGFKGAYETWTCDQSVRKYQNEIETVRESWFCDQNVHELGDESETVRDSQCSPQSLHELGDASETFREIQYRSQSVHDRQSESETVRGIQLHGLSAHELQTENETVHESRADCQDVCGLCGENMKVRELLRCGNDHGRRDVNETDHVTHTRGLSFCMLHDESDPAPEISVRVSTAHGGYPRDDYIVQD